MYARQKRYFTGNRSDSLCVTAINTLAILDNMLTDKFIFKIADKSLDLLALPLILSRKSNDCLLDDSINNVVSLLLGFDTDSLNSPIVPEKINLEKLTS